MGISQDSRSSRSSRCVDLSSSRDEDSWTVYDGRTALGLLYIEDDTRVVYEKTGRFGNGTYTREFEDRAAAERFVEGLDAGRKKLGDLLE